MEQARASGPAFVLFVGALAGGRSNAVEKSADATDATSVRSAAPVATKPPTSESPSGDSAASQSGAAAGETPDTSADGKLDSALIDTIERQRGAELPGRPRLQVAPDGTVLVDIEAKVGPALLEKIRKLGGTVVSSVPRFDTVRARVLVASLRTLALESDVRSIRHAVEPMTNSAVDAATLR
jgi:hypothetical protein